jgi:hypothetical protein
MWAPANKKKIEKQATKINMTQTRVLQDVTNN